MRLLDVAKVERGTGRWYRGFERDSWACAVDVALVDACSADDRAGQLLGDNTSTPGMYATLPFGIIGKLHRPVNCMSPDDDKWLHDAMSDIEEFALERSLIVQPVAGTESWIGDDNVTAVPMWASKGADDVLTAVSTGRSAWFSHVAGKAPIMHVAASVAPLLVRAGILKINCDGQNSCCSVWGDRVVIGAGYDLPAKGNVPAYGSVFFTGDIDIRLSPIDVSDLIVDSRINRTELLATEIAVIETDPCGIVRVGDIPTGAWRLLVTAKPTQGTPRSITLTLDNGDDTQATTVNWGDGTANAQIAAGTHTATHTYANPGRYTVVTKQANSSTSSLTVDV